MSTHLSLQHAQRCIAAAIAEAQRQRLAVCVAVVDAHANLLAFVRMDDSVPGAIDLAQRKARSAALFRLPSGELGRLAGPGQPLWSIEQSNGGLACFAAGRCRRFLPGWRRRLRRQRGPGPIHRRGRRGHGNNPEVIEMKQKRILVTGAGSGFGREVALRLAARGHRTIAGVRGAGQAADLREEAGRRGVPLRVETLDITVAADRERAWEWDIDVLLNNAGSAEAGASAEIPLELVRALFETNVFANLELTQGFVRRMVEQKRGGKVLFVSSIAGLITGPYTGPYCASKHALEAFAEALHAELKPFGIQVGTINPGPYQTGFNDRMMETWKRWYDPQRHFTDHSGVRFPFEQYDPEEMIARMVELAEADEGPFRTLLPQAFVEVVKDEQAQAWQRRL